MIVVIMLCTKMLQELRVSNGTLFLKSCWFPIIQGEKKPRFMKPFVLESHSKTQSYPSISTSKPQFQGAF